MTTYNSFEAAKIANPESLICKFDDKFTIDASRFGQALQPCNPADYCMTVENFLGDGCRFNEGDAYINEKGEVVIVGRNIDRLSSNAKGRYDDRLFVLRAAALEEDKPLLQTGEEYEHTKTLNFIYERLVNVHEENPCYDYMHKLKNAIIMVEGIESPCNQSAAQEKPRTKVEYVKCEFESAWEALKSFEEGEELYRDKNQTLQTEVVEFVKAASVGGIGYILTYYKADNLYRRIETPMTEREAFVGWFESIHEVYVDSEEYDHGQLGEFLFDNGCKLVN